MAKLAVYLATFALFLFVAHASITTVTIDEENPWGRPRRSQGGCREKIRELDNLQDCQRYMEEECGTSSSSSSRRFGRHGSSSSRQYLDSCCEQLEKLDNKCRCPGLRQAVQQMRGGEMGSEEMEDAYEVAERIMSKCDMQPRRCDFPSRDRV